MTGICYTCVDTSNLLHETTSQPFCPTYQIWFVQPVVFHFTERTRSDTRHLYTPNCMNTPATWTLSFSPDLLQQPSSQSPYLMGTYLTWHVQPPISHLASLHPIHATSSPSILREHTWCGISYVFSNILRRCSKGSSSGKGYFPYSMVYRMTPHAHMSTFCSKKKTQIAQNPEEHPSQHTWKLPMHGLHHYSYCALRLILTTLHMEP
jgi:hypothetical protein